LGRGNEEFLLCVAALVDVIRVSASMQTIIRFIHYLVIGSFDSYVARWWLTGVLKQVNDIDGVFTLEFVEIDSISN